jgi:site-specific DNA recombinase
MNKVAIYCRLSDEDKDKKFATDDSESIQNQKNLLMKFAMEKGWDIYDIYCDDDYSGLDSDRPKFNQMIRDAEDGKFEIILCKTQSRFTRDMELVEKYLHNKFIEWGIRFITAVDGVDTFDKHNKKSRQINGLVNEWYCEDISESIRAVLRNKQQSGKFIGSFATFGYLKDPEDKNSLIIDEAAAEVVRIIFSLYLQGNGTQHIAYILNEKGIPNPTKYKKLQGLKYKNSSDKNKLGLWNKTTVKRILKNQMYLGKMVQHKYQKISYKSKKTINLKQNEWVIVEGTHSPIIDKDTFEMVQNRMSCNTRSDGSGKIHIFAGKLKCMDCGSTLIKTTNGAGRTYMRCKLHVVSKNKNLCTSHSIRFDVLNEIVTNKVNHHIETLCNETDLSIKLMNENGINGKLQMLKKELSHIDKEFESRTKALKNLYLDKINGVIQEEQFNDLNQAFLNEKKEIAKRKSILEDNIEKLISRKNNFDEYIRIVKKYKNFTELNYSLINELIDYIEISEKDKTVGEQKIKIHWNF